MNSEGNYRSMEDARNIVVSLDQAEELIRNLQRAVAEAKDHQTTQSAFLPLIGFSIFVNPFLERHYRDHK